MMANQVDSLDELILAALQENGRLTMKSLAEQVGLSSPAMIERVRRLEERGVISGYRAIVAPAALGRPISALIAAIVDRRDQEAFSRQVQEQAAVAEVHRTTGDATHLVKVNVPDMTTLEKIVDDLSETGARCQTTIILSSPVPYRPITLPEGLTVQRSRLTRRRRRTVAEDGSNGETPKRPGRPRGRRPAAA
ncbi:MAG TPA: Lrp/AsnC family transcriptional regulator [Thermomicrobiales bacterium]|jgi:Lrp/AsnC family leucine-responsive transcriptional regulator|nr:Lrp/AsnC family transcriptional regulator [Thermomicrobiales bacterium]